jgi:hypothetical protein
VNLYIRLLNRGWGCEAVDDRGHRELIVRQVALLAMSNCMAPFNRSEAIRREAHRRRRRFRLWVASIAGLVLACWGLGVYLEVFR